MPDETPETPGKKKREDNLIPGGTRAPLGDKVTSSEAHRRANLDPTIFQAASRANSKATLAVKAALTVDAGIKEMKKIEASIKREAKLVEPRVVVVGGASQKRPRVNFTAERRAEYLDLVRQGIGPHKAARQVGANPQAVWAAKQADPDFAQECVWACEEALELGVEKQRRNAEDGDLAAMKWLFEVYAPHLYSQSNKSVKVEVSGQIESVTGAGREAQIERIKKLTDTLAARAALRAGGDEIEDAEVLDEMTDDDPPNENLARYAAPQIEDSEDYDEPYGHRDFRRDVGF